MVVCVCVCWLVCVCVATSVFPCYMCTEYMDISLLFMRQHSYSKCPFDHGNERFPIPLFKKGH